MMSIRHVLDVLIAITAVICVGCCAFGSLSELRKVRRARRQQVQREWPGIDPAYVRLTLAELAEAYGERIAKARCGGERRALLEQWAKAASDELTGLDTAEFRHQRAVYRAVLEEVEGV